MAASCANMRLCFSKAHILHTNLIFRQFEPSVLWHANPQVHAEPQKIKKLRPGLDYLPSGNKSMEADSQNWSIKSFMTAENIANRDVNHQRLSESSSSAFESSFEGENSNVSCDGFGMGNTRMIPEAQGSTLGRVDEPGQHKCRASTEQNTSRDFQVMSGHWMTDSRLPGNTYDSAYEDLSTNDGTMYGRHASDASRHQWTEELSTAMHNASEHANGQSSMGLYQAQLDRIPVGHGPYITQRDFRATQYLTNSDMVSSWYTSIKSLWPIDFLLQWSWRQ